MELRLDGDAFAWAWTPNVGAPDQRIRMDLLPDLALLCSAGRGRRVDEADVHDDKTLTLLVSVHLGAKGSATVNGSPVSEAALANMASAGLMKTMRRGMEADLEDRDEG